MLPKLHAFRVVEPESRHIEPPPVEPEPVAVAAAPAPPVQPLTPDAQIRRLIENSFPPVIAASDADVELINDGRVVAGLEGGLALPGVGVAARGWLVDPEGVVEAVWVQCGETLKPACFAASDYRRDALEYTGLLNERPGYRAGFVLLDPDLQPAGGEPVLFLYIVINDRHGRRLLSAGRMLASGASVGAGRLFHEFHSRTLQPSAMRAAAPAFLRAVAAEADGWRDARVTSIFGGARRDLRTTVVIALDQNVELLPHLLAMLEMMAEAERTEVMLVLCQPDIENPVLGQVRRHRRSAPFAALTVVTPTRRVTYGAALNEGVRLARGEMLALMRDDMLPPVDHWDSRAREVLDAGQEAVLPEVWTFDQRRMSMDMALRLDGAEFEQDHSEIEEACEEGAGRRLRRLSSGVLIAYRSTMLSSGGFDEAYTLPDWTIFDFLLRNSQGAPAFAARLPSNFQHFQLKAFSWGDPVERLWNAYAAWPALQSEATQAEAPLGSEAPSAPAFAAP